MPKFAICRSIGRRKGHLKKAAERPKGRFNPYILGIAKRTASKGDLTSTALSPHPY